jgi:hypothetical protein
MTSKKTWAVPVVTVLAAASYSGTALATPSRGVTTSLLANKIAFVDAVGQRARNPTESIFGRACARHRSARRARAEQLACDFVKGVISNGST